MKHSKVSAETRDKSIKDADLGAGSWALKTIKSVTAFRKRKSGAVPTGEIVYRAVQVIAGLAVFMTGKLVLGVPSNFLSGLVLLGFLFGAQFGALRFTAFSGIYWGIVGTVLGLSPLGVWPLSASWWEEASSAFQNEQTGLWPVVAALLVTSVIWIAAGRLACKGIGRAVTTGVENWTFEQSQEVQKRRVEEIEEEFERTGVTRSEIDDLARRNESDRRRAIVFGGGVRRKKAETESVSLAKTEVSADVEAGESAQRLSDLAGKIDEKDASVLEGLASGPDFGSLGNFGATVAPSGDAADPDEIPGPSANAHMEAVSAEEDEDLIPGPSNAAVAVPAVVSAAEPSTAIMEVVEKLEQPAPAVSAPKINPEASRGRRRTSREDLGKMIDMFNVMSREDNIELFVMATKSKLIRLTDEDYEELRTLEGGDILITLSQDLKLNDQARGRSAVMSRPEPAEEEITGSNSEMSNNDSPSAPGALLADALSLVRNSASGRVPLGAAPAASPAPPANAESEDFEDEAASASAPAVSSRNGDAAESDDEKPHEISAVTARGESVSFEVDITENESGDFEMRRYPTQYASERVTILNHPTMTNEQKIEHLRSLDRAQNVSTIDMFTSNDISGIINLPAKVLAKLSDKAVELLGQAPTSMEALQGLLDRRIKIVQQDLFQKPHEYQRILGVFVTLGAEIQEMVIRIDQPVAREILDHSMRLDPWFEQNLAGVRSGKLTEALPLPERGPGILDRFSGTVNAALRGAGFAGMTPAVAAPAPSEEADVVPASEVIIDVPQVRSPAPQEDVPQPRQLRKGVDAQWTPDAPPGSDDYSLQMSEHFQMIVRRNDERAVEERRLEEENRLRVERERQENEAREREENDRRAREQEQADLVRRHEAFFAGLPRTDGAYFVKSVPARFFVENILSAIVGIVDGIAIAGRLRRDHAAAKMLFMRDWESEKGSRPDAADELLAPGEKLQAEVAVRNGDLARGILSGMGLECGLTADASQDEIVARLADDEERLFMQRVDRVIAIGGELRERIAVAERREKAMIAEAAREAALREVKQGGESEERVSQLEQDLGEREREAEALRQTAREAEERAMAAEREAQQRQEAADQAVRDAEEMKERIRLLERQLAEGQASEQADGEVQDEPELSDREKVDRFLGEHFDVLEGNSEQRIFVKKSAGGFFVVVDLPDECVVNNFMQVKGTDLPLRTVLKRTVINPVLALDPLLNVSSLVIVTNAELPAEITDENLDINKGAIHVAPRSVSGDGGVSAVLRGWGML